MSLVRSLLDVGGINFIFMRSLSNIFVHVYQKEESKVSEYFSRLAFQIKMGL